MASAIVLFYFYKCSLVHFFVFFKTKMPLGIKSLLVISILSIFLMKVYIMSYLFYLPASGCKSCRLCDWTIWYQLVNCSIPSERRYIPILPLLQDLNMHHPSRNKDSVWFCTCFPSLLAIETATRVWEEMHGCCYSGQAEISSHFSFSVLF